MTPSPNLPLPFDGDAVAQAARIDARDRAARVRAVDPRFNVALEASAGTGKTRVLVDRYINLLRAGVDPANILAMTFTRKAATEMRDRILDTLRMSAARGEITPARWRELQDRSGDIAISTIDAFCLSLLREFPLEADLDPGFAIADDTDVPRLVDESLDRALRICRGVAREDEQVALVFAQLGERRARTGLASLLARRIVAPGILGRFLSRNRRDLTVDGAAAAAASTLLGVFASMTPASGDDPGEGLRAFVMSGPTDPGFMLFVQQLERLEAAVRDGRPPDARLVYAAFARARSYFLTQNGEPRSRLTHAKDAFASEGHWRSHRALVSGHASAVASAMRAYRHDINVLVSGGVWRMYRIAEREYRRTLDAHAVLDFSDLLLRTLDLLRRMEEFARSRYRLESRYHHVLVDEFQDTSRAQWELMALLVEAWGQGAGLAHSHPLPPSIFIVGDRKQSIYGFRDADVSVLGDAVRFLQGLRPDRDVRRSISRSFRSVPALLAFVNDVCQEIDKVRDRPDAFEYGEDDRFPIDAGAVGPGSLDPPSHEPIPASDASILPSDALGLVPGDTPGVCAETVAGEVARLIRTGATVRDVATGVRRAARPGDMAILFRTRESHRAFEEALQRHGIPSYVYKGLGFFDADEIRDVLALLGFLAEPASNLRAAAWLRSGFVRLSDEGLRRLGPELAGALTAPAPPTPPVPLDTRDVRSLDLARAACRRWLALVDRIHPAELLDRAIRESSYTMEMRGARGRQARENLKKLRALVRRAQNKGYATVGRIVGHLDRMAVGDESNASIDARDAVNLMTVHAAKGLEFPVVFIVNLTRGTGGRREPIRVTALGDDDVSVSVGDFQSVSDDDQVAQEREETKRLLYVALTRARDRLYLSTAVKEGRVQPGRGSLGEILPASLLEQFVATHGDSATWRGGTGGLHTLRIVRPSQAPQAPVDEPDAVVVELSTDFAPLAGAHESAAAGERHIEDSAGTAEPPSTRGSDRLVGTLVHRLVQRFGLRTGGADAMDVGVAVAWQLLRAEERESLIGVEAPVEQAVEFFQGLRQRADVRRLYESGRPWHEVPFSLVVDGVPTRGFIDCVVVRQVAGAPVAGGLQASEKEPVEKEPVAGGLQASEKEPVASEKEPVAGGLQASESLVDHVNLLEFKTGRPRDEHRQQVQVYRRAAEALFPGAQVHAVLVYREHVEPV